MRALSILLLTLGLACRGQSVDEPPPLELSVAMEAQVSVARGLGYLVNEQDKDGSWSEHPGITAACTAALVGVATEKEQAAIDRGLVYLRQQVRQDGTVGLRPGEVDVYATSITLIAFTLANREADRDLIGRMTRALREHQLPRGMAYAPGGFRYHTDRYPDLSNTHWALEAIYLVSARLPDVIDDEQAQARLWSTSRKLILSCQYPEDADSEVAGGFTYYPLDSERTPRHEQELAAARVWGSLTYGGVKSLLYTGMARDAAAVQAAHDWLLQHYSVQENPGLGKGGLYYHLYMMVTAHELLGDGTLPLPNGKQLNWRHDTVDHLLTVQKGNGSWQNDNPLWMENDPNLCTGYALLALEIILSD